jgi:hypothetical protein
LKVGAGAEKNSFGSATLTFTVGLPLSQISAFRHDGQSGNDNHGLVKMASSVDVCGTKTPQKQGTPGKHFLLRSYRCTYARETQCDCT